MASRAFTAMLTSAVSNWLTSASTKQRSQAISVTIWMREPTMVRSMSVIAADALGDVEHLGLERLPARKGQELARELGGAVHRVGDRVDVAPPALLGQVGPAQEVGRRADDGEQVVEVVRDAAGELAHRLHLLRLPQGRLSLLPLGNGIDDAGLQLLVQPAQGRLGLLAVGDVEHELDHLVANPARREQPPPARTIFAEVLLLVGGGSRPFVVTSSTARQDSGWNSSGVSSCQVLPIASSRLKPVMRRKASFASVS